MPSTVPSLNPLPEKTWNQPQQRIGLRYALSQHRSPHLFGPRCAVAVVPLILVGVSKPQTCSTPSTPCSPRASSHQSSTHPLPSLSHFPDFSSRSPRRRYQHLVQALPDTALLPSLNAVTPVFEHLSSWVLQGYRQANCTPGYSIPCTTCDRWFKFLMILQKTL